MINGQSITDIEKIPVTIEPNKYDEIIAEIAELIYRTACNAENKSAWSSNKKDTLLPPPNENFFARGEISCQPN